MLHSRIMSRPFVYLDTYAKTDRCSLTFSSLEGRLAITLNGCLRTLYCTSNLIVARLSESYEGSRNLLVNSRRGRTLIVWKYLFDMLTSLS